MKKAILFLVLIFSFSVYFFNKEDEIPEINQTHFQSLIRCMVNRSCNQQTDAGFVEGFKVFYADLRGEGYDVRYLFSPQTKAFSVMFDRSKEDGIKITIADSNDDGVVDMVVFSSSSGVAFRILLPKDSEFQKNFLEYQKIYVESLEEAYRVLVKGSENKIINGGKVI